MSSSETTSRCIKCCFYCHLMPSRDIPEQLQPCYSNQAPTSCSSSIFLQSQAPNSNPPPFYSQALFVCVGLVGRNDSESDCFSNLYKLWLAETIPGAIRRKRTRPQPTCLLLDVTSNPQYYPHEQPRYSHVANLPHTKQHEKIKENKMSFWAATTEPVTPMRPTCLHQTTREN
jgi:hypothetical protein